MSTASSHRTARSTARQAPQRTTCALCQRTVDPMHPGLEWAEVPCHVRAFAGQRFHVWRCSNCRTLSCLEVVDLGHYYSSYPFASAQLSWPFRQFYRNLERRLTDHGLKASHALLDYGCGNGLFVKQLRKHGFSGAVGFDPYGSPEEWGDRSVLERGPFDFILLQDVLEHVEDPRQLLRQMDRLLKPGGKILVGTPNAEQINLRRPQEYLNELHAPYHLHIYNRAGLTQLGRETGWREVTFFDRAYHDLPWPGLNARAAKAYQRLADGTMDALFEPLQAWRLASSPWFWFYALCGYGLSYRADMAMLFEKG
jgi:SAM-dependent methyltransferase